MGDAVHDEDSGRADDGVRQPDSSLYGNSVPRRSDLIPRISRAEAAPDRQLHQHRVFGIHAEVAARVRLGRTELRHLIVTEAVGGKGERPKRDSHHHDRREGQRDELCASQRNSDSTSASVFVPFNGVGDEESELTGLYDYAVAYR